MEITGNIKVIQDIESGTSKAGNEWQKRNIVVTTAGDYPQNLLIEFFGKTVQALENFQVGNPVKVHINLKGNEYNGKYYNSISGWKIQNYIAEHTNEAQNPAREVETIDAGDLPF